MKTTLEYIKICFVIDLIAMFSLTYNFLFFLDVQKKDASDMNTDFILEGRDQPSKRQKWLQMSK